MPRPTGADQSHVLPVLAQILSFRSRFVELLNLYRVWALERCEYRTRDSLR